MVGSEALDTTRLYPPVEQHADQKIQENIDSTLHVDPPTELHVVPITQLLHQSIIEDDQPSTQCVREQIKNVHLTSEDDVPISQLIAPQARHHVTETQQNKQLKYVDANTKFVSKPLKNCIPQYTQNLEEKITKSTIEQMVVFIKSELIDHEEDDTEGGSVDRQGGAASPARGPSQCNVLVKLEPDVSEEDLVRVTLESAERPVDKAVKSESTSSDDSDDAGETCGDVGRFLTTVITTAGVPEEADAEVEGGTPCDICHRTFRNKQGLAAHKNRIHFVKLIGGTGRDGRAVSRTGEMKCNQCNKKYVNKKSLMKHINKEHLTNNGERHRCHDCGKNFRLRNSLWMHRFSKHNPNDQRQPCEYCHRVLRTQRTYKEHLRKMHPSAYLHREGRPAPGEAEAISITRPHHCHICGGEYVSGTILRKHISSVHPRPEESRACPLCQRSFKTEHRLQNHLENKHSPAGERRKCLECGQVYKNKYSFQFHMKHTHGKRVKLGEGGVACDPEEPLASRTRVRRYARKPRGHVDIQIEPDHYPHYSEEEPDNVKKEPEDVDTEYILP